MLSAFSPVGVSGYAVELPPFPVVVTFERPVQFLREDGESVAVATATYLVSSTV